MTPSLSPLNSLLCNFNSFFYSHDIDKNYRQIQAFHKSLIPSRYKELIHQLLLPFSHFIILIGHLIKLSSTSTSDSTSKLYTIQQLINFIKNLSNPIHNHHFFLCVVFISLCNLLLMNISRKLSPF